jgi:hypothetical protein
VRAGTYVVRATSERDPFGHSGGDECAIPLAREAEHPQHPMESHTSVAEDLPALYRAILDGVAQLEGLGQRREAGLVRSEATHVYSTSWDEAGLRRLAQLRRRIERIVAGTERPRGSRSRSWRIPRTMQTPQHGPV